MISFAPLTPRHFGPLLRGMREIDRRECALSGFAPKAALRFGMVHGEAVTVLDDGQPIAVFGVVPTSLLTGDATVWMFATDAATGRAREWLLAGRVFVAALMKRYERLRNVVHRDNRLAIRWLTRIGFTVEPEVEGKQFRRFEICAYQQPPLL